MATESEIATKMNEVLRASGYVCGRSYADIGSLTKSLAGQLPNETVSSLDPKVRHIISDPQYKFKTTGQNDVSASDKCGNEAQN